MARKFKRSKGAPFVNQLPLVVHEMEEEPKGPILYWSPSCSIFVEANGRSQPIWGIPLREAYELCKLKSVELRIQTRSHRQ